MHRLLWIRSHSIVTLELNIWYNYTESTPSPVRINQSVAEVCIPRFYTKLNQHSGTGAQQFAFLNDHFQVMLMLSKIWKPCLFGFILYLPGEWNLAENGSVSFKLFVLGRKSRWQPSAIIVFAFNRLLLHSDIFCMLGTFI